MKQLSNVPMTVFIPFDILYGLQSVGQIIDEAVEPGCHCLDDAKSGVSSPDEGEKCSRRPDMDTGAGKGTSLPTRDLLNPLQKTAPSHLSSSYPCFLLLPPFFSFHLVNMVAGGG